VLGGGEIERDKDKEAPKKKQKDSVVALEEVPFLTSLKPQKNKRIQRKTFYGYTIKEEENEEGSKTGEQSNY